MNHTTFLFQDQEISFAKSSAVDVGEWVYCPICKHKTRIKIRKDTILERFPLHCPKCGNISLINAKNLKIAVID